MRKSAPWLPLLLPLLVLLPLGLGLGGCASDIGDACDKPGSTGQCTDGAVCTNEGASAVCRWLCKDKGQCGADEDCNGISGSSLKSCQPKS